MMDIRKRIFLGASVVIGLIIVLILSFMFFSREQAPETETPQEQGTQTQTQPQGTDTPTEVQTPPVQLSPEEITDRYVRQFASLFVERFGSYSNQNSGSHITDILPLVTPSMQRWLETQYTDNEQQYSGVTTQVIVSNLTSREDGNATVAVDTQQLIRENGEERIEQRSGRVELIGSGNDWKVDGFFWEK